MARRVSFSNLNPGLQRIADHHSDLDAALKAYYRLSGRGGHLPAKFALYSRDELLTEFRERIHELERTSCLTLLSSLEASFRIDYLTRCYGKEKNELSRHLRSIHDTKGNRASLEDDILRTWKQHHPQIKSLVSELIGAFKYRHWLAHGRYWTAKLGRKYDDFYVFAPAERTYDSIPLVK